MKQVQKLVNEMRMMKANKEAISPEEIEERKNPENYEKTKREAEELQRKIQSAYQQIKTALKEANLTKEDLDPDNQDWELIEHAKSEKVMNDTKNKVLADIKSKREAKQKSGDKRKREEEDNSSNKKAKNDFDNLKNGVLNEIDDRVIAAGLEVSVRFEGNKDFTANSQVKAGEEKLIEENFDLYKETIIKALKERMKDQGLEVKDLDEETKKLINGEITDKTQFKSAKEQVVKKLGELGAKNKWGDLFARAKATLANIKKETSAIAQQKLKELHKEFDNLKSKISQNSYFKNYYDINQSEINKLEKVLNSHLTNHNPTLENKGFWQPKVIIPTVLVGGLAIVGIVLVIRNRKSKGKVK